MRRAIFPLILIIILAPILIYSLYYIDRIYPNTSVAGVALGGLSRTQASELLKSRVVPPEKISLKTSGEPFDLTIDQIGLSYDFPASAQKAYDTTRTGDILKDFVKRLTLLGRSENLNLEFSVNEESLDKIISVVAGQISQQPVYPSISLIDKSIQVTRGSVGSEVDQEALRNQIYAKLSQAVGGEIQVPTVIVDPTLSDMESGALTKRAEKYLDKKIELKFEFQTFYLETSQLFSFLNPDGGYKDSEIEKETTKIAKNIERDPINPKFEFLNNKVSEFEPSKDGIKLDAVAFKAKLIEVLDSIPESSEKSVAFDIPTIKTPPKISISEVNDFGIKELIGRGTSTYYHSIPSRVHNVSLASKTISGTLVPPGDTFSFNRILGDVSKFTGYQTAYIIQNGKTVLGDGGGVCQVSTTLFRAVLAAGLPIDERHAHAYRVSYYEQGSSPGLDATVYDPSPDFKFTNDTGNYILIVAKADPKNYSLVFELYGTSDGRVATTTNPVVTGTTAPPPDLYQDDPTLPVGTVKQIDFKAWGARVSFNYKVTRGEETLIDKTFVSNYRPWQAIFLRGTKI